MVDALKSNIALEMLRACLRGEQGVSVIPGKHFLKELAAEKLTLPVAWQVLKSGMIFDAPEHDVKSGEWKYHVEGYEPDGKWIVIVVSFKAVNRAYLITVFSVKEKGRPS